MEKEAFVLDNSIRWLGKFLPLSDRRLGMFFFLVSEVFLFSGLIGTYLVLRLGLLEWPPLDAPSLPKVTTFFNTLILLLSSLTFHLSHKSIKEGKMTAFKIWLITTILLGAIFLGIQGNEWAHLIALGLSLKTGVYGPSFFVLTGCHGMHLFAGVVFLSVILFQSYLGIYNIYKHTGVDLCGMYWHFVDGVWMVLFLALYII